ncbi:MAG: PKD domain-containing protein [Bacteroidales bacterium]|jgi:hypothetical protein|nr:PKD domain-containing protein [Bacteroidales bacterium]
MMKILNYITVFFAILLIAVSCEKDEENYSFDDLSAPSNVSVVFDITQDNSGLVTIIPGAEGATKFQIIFGDTIDETPTEYKVGEKITHIYEEGNYTVGITAVGLNGKKTSIDENLVVSFQAPENLIISAENDLAVSKKVNISATADYATSIEVYFGELAEDTAVVTLPGETVSHIYENPGDYDITVVAKSAAIQTLDSTFTFTVTEITGPQEAAPTPPGRVESDYISVFSDAYINLTGTNFNPNWGQSTIVTFEEVVSGDTVLKYSNLNYQGTEFASAIDASGMEYLHVDMWTEDASAVNFYAISSGPDEEKAYALPVTPETWVSYDIPLTYFDNVDLANIIQFKVDGTGGSTVYFDNIYFYRSGASTEPSLPLDFESSVIDYAWTDFDGGEVTIIDNPQSSGINTSSKVAQMVKNTGQTWGGSWIALDAPIDFSTNKTFKMKVYSPRVDAKVLLKVENLTDGGINHEVEVSTTTANEWEELTFDYSGIDDTKEYQKIVLIFDNGTAGDGSANFTWLFDDIELTSASSGDVLSGTWQMAPEAGSMGVGPAQGDMSWWAIDAAGVTQRACFFDDSYVFGTDGSFSNVLGTETWIETWQGGSDACGTPVAPHDGSAVATYSYDEGAGTVTIDGTGAFLGIPKVYNGGELTSPGDAPASITYQIVLSDNNNTMTLDIEVDGAWWRFKLIKN